MHFDVGFGGAPVDLVTFSCYYGCQPVVRMDGGMAMGYKCVRGYPYVAPRKRDWDIL